jgi:hypothetical protein
MIIHQMRTLTLLISMQPIISSCQRRWRGSIQSWELRRSFESPWPKQSYHRATDVNKEYDRRFDAITKSITMIVMFFVTSFISIPPVHTQYPRHGDPHVYHFSLLLHIRLYRIYPVLLVVSTLLLAAAIQVNFFFSRILCGSYFTATLTELFYC